MEWNIYLENNKWCENIYNIFVFCLKGFFFVVIIVCFNLIIFVYIVYIKKYVCIIMYFYVIINEN